MEIVFLIYDYCLFIKIDKLKDDKSSFIYKIYEEKRNLIKYN